MNIIDILKRGGTKNGNVITLNKNQFQKILKQNKIKIIFTDFFYGNEINFAQTLIIETYKDKRDEIYVIQPTNNGENLYLTTVQIDDDGQQHLIDDEDYVQKNTDNIFTGILKRKVRVDINIAR